MICRGSPGKMGECDAAMPTTRQRLRGIFANRKRISPPPFPRQPGASTGNQSHDLSTRRRRPHADPYFLSTTRTEVDAEIPFPECTHSGDSECSERAAVVQRAVRRFFLRGSNFQKGLGVCASWNMASARLICSGCSRATSFCSATSVGK